ncbi:helix-turn-helix domain-containing protein [Streptomyces aidingensis]|uniref:Helix-turn-helix domain-containing protein n=1 Tax=Streptomyces aidingensis TaxID=910347 RepID=A0A1I1LMY9_9ACTN|nr:helix-turn-helix transcriptional regulator [Streptomyces aidingensis]SFC74577.1 Helix-turn-helix domain-containing protein [Streptomyces aidingensis]
MSDQRRAQFGAYLASLRRTKRWSQSQLAERLCASTGVDSVTRSEVSRWEHGKRIPESWLPQLAIAFGIPLHEIQNAAAYARGDTAARLPIPNPALAELLPQASEFTSAGSTLGRRIGKNEVSLIAARAHALRLADDVLSGGDLLPTAVRELEAATHLFKETYHSGETSRQLLSVIAEMAQITGWISSDAGRCEESERVYRLGISAAREADDAPVTANLISSLAYHLSNVPGREQDAVWLAQAAVSAGRTATPRARAVFFDRIAWAQTRTEDAEVAMKALNDAHDALSKESDTNEPQWAYWVNRLELEVMDARVYTELRRPLRAVPLLTRIMSQYDASYTRETALYRSWLAIALADANEPEQAAYEAEQVLSSMSALTSDRVTERARVVLRRLGEFDAVPAVQSLRREHMYLLER